MPKCKICGARLAEGTTICPTCGANVAGSPRGGICDGTASPRASEGTPVAPVTSTTVTPESSPVETYAAGNSYAVSPEEQALMDADSWRDKCDYNVTGGWYLKEAGLYKQHGFDVAEFFTVLALVAVSIWFILGQDGEGVFIGWALLVMLIGSSIISFISRKNIFGLAAKFANPDSLCELGYRYYYGAGISQSHSKAIEYFLLSADRGDSAAKYNLGYMYYYGHGVAQDFRKAAEYFQQACSAT